MLQPDAVSAGTMDLLKELSALPVLKNFRLVGGTALALQLGHRLSIDLDFFSAERDDLSVVESEFLFRKDTFLKSSSSYALFFECSGVKVDVLNYPYAYIENAVEFTPVRMAHPKDIAAMKMKTIMNRGAKKDFYDLFFLFELYSLREMISFFADKYKNIELLSLYKNLNYFEDAEKFEDPILLRNKSLTWDDVKSKIIAETKKIF